MACWVSTRKVKAITEELCGHSSSASATSAISAINKKMDVALESFARRRLSERYPISSSMPVTRSCARMASLPRKPC